MPEMAGIWFVPKKALIGAQADEMVRVFGSYETVKKSEGS